MIEPGEIQKNAHEKGVRDTQIEKDYVLSWVLAGISTHETLSEILVFKGGTVLKKVYYEDYRYSEDLDFTLLNKDFPIQDLLPCFHEIFQFILDQANISLNILESNENENGLYFYMGYTGPLGGEGKHKRIKVDISSSEECQFEPIKKGAIISYSDLKEYELLCYTLEEVLVEKLRCVMQRMQARDFYDIWYLLEQERIDLNLLEIEFEKKCRLKELNPEDFNQVLENRIPQYRARWDQSVASQIQNLPEFQRVERETLRNLRNFF